MLEKIIKEVIAEEVRKIINDGDDTDSFATFDSDEYYIVRTYSAGVFFGHIKTRNGMEVVMTDARRIWKWGGAATLSQLAEEGVSKPEECKFPMPMKVVVVTQAIEIITCSEKAINSIKEVKIWRV